jgi:hypothetical protein
MKPLKQALVTRYAKYQALKNLLDKWLEEKRAEIVALMKRGARCPELGPFLLELGSAKDPPAWKDEFFRYLAGKIGKKQALAFLVAIEKQKRPKSPRLYSKRNANFKRKYPIRLPA